MEQRSTQPIGRAGSEGGREGVREGGTRKARSRWVGRPMEDGGVGGGR